MTRSRIPELLEKLCRLVPGISGYQDRETLRSSDRAVRERAAASVQSCRERLTALVAGLSRAGRSSIGRVGQIDRAAGGLERLEDEIRHAAYGYAGWFDAKGVSAEDLERLYQNDLGLLEAASALPALVPEVDAVQGGADWLAELGRAAEDLRRLLAGRKEVLDGRG